MAVNIRWEDPIPCSSGRTPGVNSEEMEIAEIVRANPNRWARIRDFVSSSTRAGGLANQINQGKRAAFRRFEDPSGHFEAKSRKIPDTNVTTVYVRFTLHD